jgi:dTDP-4-amino-4,6-dideoxygalactose transaminase
MNNQFAPWPSFTKDEINAVNNTLKSNKVNYWTGTECREFEKEFATWTNTEYAVSLANGTLALEAAIRAIGVMPGDEVIVTSRTFIASISSIINAGAVPVFVDVDLESQNISSKLIQSKITNKTRAIICVHLAGWPCEMDEIMKLAEDNDLYVIEDCAQAHGATYKDKPIGSIGSIGCWSFCQDKIMTTGGEGGMVTTNDKSLWRNIWEYKDHGKSYEAIYERRLDEGFKWLHESFGTNWRMTEMQAAIGRVQLKKMLAWHNQRKNNSNKIWSVAKKSKGLRVPDIPEYIEHAYYKCYVFVKQSQIKKDWSRDKIIKQINTFGVPCNSGSCSEVYLEKAFNETVFRPKQRLANARKLGDTSIMFLVHPTLTEDDINLTCDVISSVMEKAIK